MKFLGVGLVIASLIVASLAVEWTITPSGAASGQVLASVTEVPPNTCQSWYTFAAGAYTSDRLYYASPHPNCQFFETEANYDWSTGTYFYDGRVTKYLYTYCGGVDIYAVMATVTLLTTVDNHPRRIYFAPNCNYLDWSFVSANGVATIPPATVCGNGVVEGNEQCDSPNSACCTASCQFAAAGTLCRGLAGDCDEVERCTGSSDICPPDLLSPSTKACGERVGFCDVRIQNQCDGVNPRCFGVPFVQLDDFSNAFQATWENFNILSFGNFASNGGEVQGRLAVQGNLNIAGFTIGSGINTKPGGPDKFLPYSLIVGGDATWTSGSLFPDGVAPHDSIPESALVYGNVDFQNLNARRTPANITSGQPDWAKAKSFYTRIQNLLAGYAANTVVEARWGGIHVTCNNPDDQMYIINVDAAVLSASTWWDLEGCGFQSYYVINVLGSGAASVSGGDFPTITERVIYNVLGSGRTFTVASGLRGNILAPNNVVRQDTGVTKGLIIAGDIPAALSAQNPLCTKFDPVIITGRANGGFGGGGKKRQTQERIPVYSLGSFSEGDVITVGSEQTTIVGAEEISNFVFLLVEPALENTYSSGTYFTTTVNNPETANRDPLTLPSKSSNSDATSEQDQVTDAASSLQAMVVLVGLLALIAML